MEFLKNDLGHRKKGEVVEVSLSSAANIRLMDSSNFSQYRAGRQHRYYGGYVTRTPWRHPIPNSGHWYVVVDLGGHAGRVGANVRVLPGILPAAREPSLSSESDS